MGYLDGEGAEARFTAERLGDGRARVTARRDGPFRSPARAVVVRVHDDRGVRETRVTDDDAWDVEL
jgi:hypothetical protein